MNLITRYVLGDLLKVFLVSLTCLTTIILLVFLTKQAVDEGLGLEQVARLLPYVLPDALRYAIPATALFAASCVFGRMSGSNEVVALKSLGISPRRILVPAYVLALFLSLLTVWLNDVAVSWGRNGVRRVIIEAVEEIAYSRLRMRREFNSKKFSIIVKSVEGQRLIEPIFSFQGSKNRGAVTLRCEYAELRSNDQVLTLKCYNGSMHQGDGVFEFPDEYVEYEVKADEISNAQDDSHWSPSWMPLNKIYRELVSQPKKIAELQHERAAKAALQLASGDFRGIQSAEWGTEQRVLDHEFYMWHRLRAEPPRRWSAGFSCLCFLFVGSCVAIRLRNANLLSSFFACFLPILIVYYPLLAFGVSQAKSGALHPSVVWTGNTILLLWGAWVLRKVIRY